MLSDVILYKHPKRSYSYSSSCQNYKLSWKGLYLMVVGHHIKECLPK